MEGRTVVTDPVPVPALEETEITSVVETGPGPAKRTDSNGSGGGGGSEASSPWSLTEEQQVRNFKENWKKFLTYTDVDTDDNFYAFRKMDVDHEIECDPWFGTVVAKLRMDPWLDSCNKFEIDCALTGYLVSEFKMTSLDVAILMGDLEMVQKILAKPSSDPNKLLHVSSMDEGWTLNPSFLNPSLWTSGPINNCILYTPLHLAVLGGDIHIVDVLLEKDVAVNVKNWLSQMPLDYACKIGSVEMLRKLLEKSREKIDPIHIAVRNANVDFIKKLPSQNANVVDAMNRTPLHYLAAYCHHNVDALTSTIQYLGEDKKLDIKALNRRGLSAFYVAVLSCNTQLVIALLDSKFKDQIRLNEVCDKDFGPSIQIAFEGGDKFKDIEAALMECDPVKSFMERLYRDRQVYVDAANAILVGAALIASVTFASWLQPPLNYTSYSGEGYSSSSTSNLNYADVEHNIPLRAFWIFNALSFYFSIATVVCGARSVLPRSHLFIKKTVEKLRINLLVTSFLLACSVLFVIIAFAIAGTIVLTPLLKYQWCMIVPTLIGGVLCIISLFFLVKSMVENSFHTREDTKLSKARASKLGTIGTSIGTGHVAYILYYDSNSSWRDSVYNWFSFFGPKRMRENFVSD